MKKNLFIVLGMHRSGTSAITRSLATMGIDLSEEMLPPVIGDNDLGYWEDKEINSLNIDILGSIGKSWDDYSTPSKIDFEKISSTNYSSRAKIILSERTQQSTNFALKDPRMALLLPFWKPLFDEYNTKYIIPIRHPLSVFKSLLKRSPISIEKSNLLWLSYTLLSISGTQLEDRVLVDYDRFISSPENELARISKQLRLQIDEEAVREYCSDFLKKSLRHSHFSDDEWHAVNEFELLVRQTYSLALRAAADEIDVADESFYTAVEELFSDYKKYIYFASFIDNKSSDTIRLSSIVTERESQVLRLTDQVSVLTDQVTSLASERNALSRTMDECIHSASWRVTAPLRSISELVRKIFSKASGS